MKLIYSANARIPSEKAHPYQIAQMCEAFSDAGAEVTLVYPIRANPPHLDTTDIWNHYGVNHNFATRRLPIIDLFPLVRYFDGPLRRYIATMAAMVARLTYHLALLVWLQQHRNAFIYTRNTTTLALLARLWPAAARRAFFEAHTYPATKIGLRMRQGLVGRIGGWVMLTDHLRQRHVKTLGIDPEHIIVAHDAFRRARFDITGDQAVWRAQFGWPQEAFIVGYMGRFISGLEGMDKGLDTLVEAAIMLSIDNAARPLHLALVGGPKSYLERIRTRLNAAGLPSDFLLAPGMVAVENVPGYLRAFDVCTIPSPWNEFYAYYTSPLKLFEYMASAKPIVASDLPSTREVLTHEHNALLVPPSDAAALSAALRRLRDNPDLAVQLAQQAATDVKRYTWRTRAERILSFMQTVLISKRTSEH